MNCKKWLFSVLLFSSVSIGFSQTGPAGVGSSATNRFWLRADKLVGFNNGDPVNTWTDQSGNANNANGVNGPTYVLNGSAGLPAINFNGTTQHYTVTSLAALTQGEIFLVSKINNDPPAAGQSGLWRLGNSSNTHFPWINGNIYDEFGTNSRKDNIAVPPLNQLRIYNVRSASGNWANRLDGAVLFSTGSNTVSFSATPLIGQNASGNYFDGTMSEIILYNTVLNTAQRNIVENYLSSKYGVSIPTDKYLFESTHKFEVAGIGRDDASNIHNSAYSGATLGVASPSNLDDGEYLLFGNDNTSLAAWTTTEIPSANSNIQRVAREWKFDASGGSVGTVTVNIDPTKFPVLPSQYTTYYLMVDADGDFTSGATLYRINSSNQATGVTIADGAFATVACVRPVVQFTQTISNALENAGSATIQVSLNYASSALVTVPFTINGASTATGGGTDYSISASPISIAAGNLSANATITINNDGFVEPDETVILNMGSPTGAQAGTNSTHTFSINDDDNGFTIGFNTNTVAVNESTGTFNLTVQLNAATIPTVTVDYYVTSVTATGGIDYVLASGTATIVNPATTTTIPVIINEDALDEADETFVITLTNPINANLAGFNQLTFTIQDNDPAPTVAFSSATSAGSEAVGLASSVIQLSSVSGQDVVVNYAIADISATGGGVDYFVPASPITIPAGSTNFNLISIISEDVLIEGSETYSITLTGATGATLGATLTQTISISDNDNTGFVGPGGVGDATVNRLWIKADALVGFSDGQTVPTWTDVSGNSSSVTGVNSPAYRANVINGKPAIEFKASEADYYNLPNYTSLTQGEVFIITKINNDPPVASSTGLWRFGVSSNTHYPWVNGNLYDEFGTNVRKDNIAIPPLNQLRLYSVRSLPGSWVN
ncbi:MAG: hypothetical protein IM574_07040, partial [Cytophagales bacterium]|nr:hypothetical protein [Cytophagales bacterium]